MHTKIREESWMGQLIKTYEKILSPKFETATLDKANKTICKALAELEQLIKKDPVAQAYAAGLFDGEGSKKVRRT